MGKERNAPNALALLRARRERPRHDHTAKKGDELAPSHELISNEGPQSSTSSENEGAVHCSDIFPLMSVQGPNPDLSASARMSPSASCGHDAVLALGSNVPIADILSARGCPSG